MFLAFFDLAGVKFLLKVERTFFFGVLPSKYSGRWRNTADEVLAKLFFGERISQNTRLIFFEFGCRKWKRRVRSEYMELRKAGLSEGEGCGVAEFSSRKISVTWGGIFHLLRFLFGGIGAGRLSIKAWTA